MKVFISYSWDSDAHKEWVQNLADSIEAAGDYEAVYDQIGMDHQVDRNQFMEQGIFGSDAVLAIVTTAYTEKANTRKGGVGRETSMAAERHWNEINLKARTRVLALKREALTALPNYLSASLYFDFVDDAKFQSSLESLVQELKKIQKESHGPIGTDIKSGNSVNAESSEEIYSFTRAEDLVASYFPVRTPLLVGDQSKDYSSQRKVRYELWLVSTPVAQLLLVLSQNINIRQTLEHFVSKLEKMNPEMRSIRSLVVLRPTPAQTGYINQQLNSLGKRFELTELTFKDYLSTYCVKANRFDFPIPFKEPFYIDQHVYLKQGDAEKLLGPAKSALADEILKPTASPLALLTAAGGTGKTTLFRWLASEINSRGKGKVLLMEIDILKKLSREEIRKARVSSLFDLYQLYVLALAKDGGELTAQVVSERALFDLLLISGGVVILIDGIDELFSLLHENFHLEAFVNSIYELHAQLGETRVMLASRDDSTGTTVHVIQSSGVPIYTLRGFTEAEVESYTKKRFAKRVSAEITRLSSRVLENVRAVSEGRGGVSVVLPFFVDVLCEVEEDASHETDNKYQKAVAEKLADAGYPHNDALVDLLVFSILDRERERQDWSPSVADLVEVFKELSSSYSGICTQSNFDAAVETFVGTSGPAAVESFSKNPLIKLVDGNVTYKYDFLNGYFLSLWLIQGLEETTKSDFVIKHLARFTQGQGTVFDDIVKFYSQRPVGHVREIARKIYQYLKTGLPTANAEANDAVEKRKDSASTICHIFAGSCSSRLSRKDFSEALLGIVGEELVEGKRRVSNMHIHGDFPVIYFPAVEIWYSQFIGYESFSKCKFDSKTIFLYCSFVGISGVNKSPSFGKHIFDRSSCSLGDMGGMFNGAQQSVGAMAVPTDEFKKFFRYFFVGGAFGERQRQDLYRFSIPSLDDLIVQSLIEAKILEVKTRQGYHAYAVSSASQRAVQKFVNENNMSKELRAAIRPWTHGTS